MIMDIILILSIGLFFVAFSMPFQNIPLAIGGFVIIFIAIIMGVQREIKEAKKKNE